MTEVVEMNQTEKNGKIFLYPFLAMLIGSIMLVATLFMPFASATEDYKEYLEEYPDSMYAEELDMTNKEAINISLFEFAKVYFVTAEMGMSKSVSIACVVIIAAFGAFALLTLLFSVLKKPIPAIIFNFLTFAVFRITKWDFGDRGVIPSINYDWGMAEYFCYIGVVVLTVGAVALLVVKIKDKKQRKALKVKALEEQ